MSQKEAMERPLSPREHISKGQNFISYLGVRLSKAIYRDDEQYVSEPWIQHVGNSNDMIDYDEWRSSILFQRDVAIGFALDEPLLIEDNDTLKPRVIYKMANELNWDVHIIDLSSFS